MVSSVTSFSRQTAIAMRLVANGYHPGGIRVTFLVANVQHPGGIRVTCLVPTGHRPGGITIHLLELIVTAHVDPLGTKCHPLELIAILPCYGATHVRSIVGIATHQRHTVLSLAPTPCHLAQPGMAKTGCSRAR